MPSLLPGFEYDVFISYRQKDNKYDGWVTEFVVNLRKELEATVKDDLSVYFDENPHDGLHDHHDVADSLKGKLKCLVFIPIISKTYCDPRSFAWEHEFKAFVRQASSDPIGIKVKSSGGNVASRVLPVMIHELGQEDVKLFEQVTQSVLRPIDFIYKSAGVNRALLRDDKKEENSYHTSYRNQINKVANAVSEIISAITHKGRPAMAVSKVERDFPKRDLRTMRKTIAAVSIAIVLAVLTYFIFQAIQGRIDPTTAGVAVIPFRNNTGDAELNFLGIGMASEIITRLSMSKKFELISPLQATLAYSNTDKSPKQIGNDMGVDFILSGIYHKAGDRIKVEIALADVTDGRVVWAFSHDGILEDIFALRSDVATEVLDHLAGKATTQIESVGTTSSIEAYAHYTKGYQMYYDRSDSGTSAARMRPAIEQFEKAIAIDSGFADAWVGLIDAESIIHWGAPNDQERKVRLNRYHDYFSKHFGDSWQWNLVRGIYAYRVEGNNDVASASMLKVLEQDPNNLVAIRFSAALNKRKLNLYQAIKLEVKVLELDPVHSEHWDDLGEILAIMGDQKNSFRAYLKAWSLWPIKRTAIAAIRRAVYADLPLSDLPDDLKLISDTEYWTKVMARDWNGLKEDSSPWRKVWVCFMLEQKDSTKFFAQEILRLGDTRSENYALAGDRSGAFIALERNLTRATRIEDDKLLQCLNLREEIFIHVLLSEYPEATQKLKDLNTKYPDYGDYARFKVYPWFDKIKKEYPPFQEALDNLKLKPMVDVTEFIKF